MAIRNKSFLKKSKQLDDSVPVSEFIVPFCKLSAPLEAAGHLTAYTSELKELFGFPKPCLNWHNFIMLGNFQVII